MWEKSHNSYNSMFKTINDYEIKNINKRLTGNYFYTRYSGDSCIKKYHSNSAEFIKDLRMCFKYEDLGIFPPISMNETFIIYDLTGMISLRAFLIENPRKFSLIIYELYEFIKHFKDCDFIHGNLNIDTVFVSEKLEFRVIDSIEQKENSIHDIVSIQDSLYEFYKKSPKHLAII